MKINCLEKMITSGNRNYRIFIGFAKATDLLSVADVPSFKNTTSAVQIASNVLSPPIKEWQRPLIENKKASIVKAFNNTGAFMPNPVLLAERCIDSETGITIQNLAAGNGIPTEIKEVTIPFTDPKPLWIIDGQHRISGLGDPNCLQKDNYIPVVLLLNAGERWFTGKDLAQIFAQVTTEATPLDSLHNEWLTYAFQLKSYSGNEARLKSMKTVALLCKEQTNNITKLVNVFHDKIKFNDNDTSPPQYGYKYDCIDMTKLIYDHYYNMDETHAKLQPNSLGDQMSMAFDELKKHVKAPHSNSVFFGDSDHCQKIVIDAFFCGVFSYLLKVNSNPALSDWTLLFNNLKMIDVDWNFKRHISNGTRWVDNSKDLAIRVFKKFFVDGTLPPNVANIWDFLCGDQLGVKITLKVVGADGRPARKNEQKYNLRSGDSKTLTGYSYFVITPTTENANNFRVIDAESRPGTQITKLKSKSNLKKLTNKNLLQDPLKIKIVFELYGGNTKEISIVLQDWK